MSTYRNYFYVYQNKTYYEEKAGSFLWSPQFASGGRRNAGYETMKQVCPGDVIFHSYQSELVAISIAKSKCYSAMRPSAAFSEWELNGWKIDTEYFVFPYGIAISDHIPELYKIQPSNGPYTVQFRGKQQYLCNANKAMFDYIVNNIISKRPLLHEKFKKFLGIENNILESNIKTDNSANDNIILSPSTSIDKCNFSLRIWTCLTLAKIYTIQDILNLNAFKLLIIPNLKINGAKEVLQKLDKYGLRISDCGKEKYPDLDIYLNNISQIAETERYTDNPLSPSTSINECKFSVRSWNCLTRAKIKTVQDIMNLNAYDLLHIRNLSKSYIEEILEKLDKSGIRISDCSKEKYPNLDTYLNNISQIAETERSSLSTPKDTNDNGKKESSILRDSLIEEKIILQREINIASKNLENYLDLLENPNNDITEKDYTILIQDIEEKNKQLIKVNSICRAFGDMIPVIERIVKSSNRIKQLLINEKDRLLNKTGFAEIGFADFIVKTNIFKCNLQHNIEQIKALVDIMTDTGVVISEEFTAGFCRECKCYFILESDYIRLRSKGILLCQQISYETYQRNGTAIMNGDNLKPESLLHQCGYNVSATEALSPIQRREILCRVVDNGLYSISGICSHLDWLIKRNKRVYNRDMSEAIAKWENDRKFISEYKSEQNRKVIVHSIKKR